MIGAVFSLKDPRLSLTTLEEIWTSHQPNTGILSTLQPTLAKILLKQDRTLFLDTMKFVAMLVSELFDKAERDVLCGFTERFLAAAHSTANRFYSNHTFDQHRFLDCISAILSVWTDCTKQQDLIIPKYVVYTRGSHIHVLDAILQSLNISDQLKCKLLDQITSLSNTELFVKYTIVGREFPKHKLHSLSEQPSEDTFRCWLLKHNITTIRSVSDFLSSNRSDEDLLSAMCRPFYNLPLSSDSQATDTAAYEPEPEINPDSLFFFDRGTKPAKSKKEEEKEEEKVLSDKEEPMSTDNSPKAPLAPKDDIIEKEVVDVPDNSEVEKPVKMQEDPEPSIAVEDQPPEPPESCIKIRNLRKRRGIVDTPASEVIVVKCPTTKPPSDMENKSNTTAPITEERLATLPDRPSVHKSTRKRRTSDVSIASVTSVDSVASRTRNRARAESLEVIAEERGKTVDRSPSVGKLRTPAERTPAVKFTPAAKETTGKRGKSRKVSETIDETPQIHVRKTRSRKLEV